MIQPVSARRAMPAASASRPTTVAARIFRRRPRVMANRRRLKYISVMDRAVRGYARQSIRAALIAMVGKGPRSPHSLYAANAATTPISAPTSTSDG